MPRLSSKRLREAIDRLQRIVDSGEEVLLVAMQRVEKQLNRSLAGLINGLPQKSGKFNVANTNELRGIRGAILRAVNSVDTNTPLKKFITNFDRIRKLNIDVLDTVNAINSGRVPLTELQKSAIGQIAIRLSPESVGGVLEEPIRNILFRHVTMGGGVEEAKEKLRDFIIGSGRRGRLCAYVGQIAADSLSQWDGTVQGRIAQEFKLKDWRYVPGVIATSRPQCVRWVIDKGGIILGGELEAEVNWALSNGQGYSAATPLTPETFPIYRGGHNCRHRAIAFNATDEGAMKRLDKAAERKGKKENEIQLLRRLLNEGQITKDDIRGRPDFKQIVSGQ